VETDGCPSTLPSGEVTLLKPMTMQMKRFSSAASIPHSVRSFEQSETTIVAMEYFSIMSH
jgi:hypothetical protein